MDAAAAKRRAPAAPHMPAAPRRSRLAPSPREESAMTKFKHWHWALMVGVFVVAFLVMSRSAAMAALVG